MHIETDACFLSVMPRTCTVPPEARG
jgi:hypothetical protein